MRSAARWRRRPIAPASSSAPSMPARVPAVRATRAQADRVLYKQAIRSMLENQPNLTLFQQEVADLLVEDERVRGVVTQTGIEFRAQRRRADGRHVPRRQDPRRADELSGRARRRSAVQPLGRAAARAAVPRRPARRPARRRASTAARSTTRASRCSRATSPCRCSHTSAVAAIIRARSAATSLRPTSARTKSFAPAAIARRCSPA